MPYLKEIQDVMREAGRTKHGSKITKPMECLADLKLWIEEHLLPDDLADVKDYTLYAVPMEDEKWDELTAVALTMKAQIDWIGQLRDNANRFAIHIDGKWKVHQGDWLLVTLGTHSTEYNDARGEVNHSFRPLMYMLTSEQETEKCILYLLEAFKKVAMQHHGFVPEPAAGVSDHGKGIMSAFKLAFPKAVMMGCWAHIAWGLSHGKLLPLSHPNFETVSEQIHEIQTCHTKGMWDVMVTALAQIWGNKDKALNDLWNSIFVYPYNNWGLWISCGCPQILANNNTEECYHNAGVAKGLKNQMNATMKHVLDWSIMRIATLDGAQNHRTTYYLRIIYVLFTCYFILL